MTARTERIVVKVGTSTLTDGTPHLSRQRMLEVVQQIARLHEAGHELVLVTSGAVAAGRERLGTSELSRSIPARQMLSAVGQSRLMQIYTDLFDIFRIVVAQLLLTRGDLNSRAGFLNARDTISTLIEHRIVPVINENDTTATEEIRIGDNDNLSALVATLVEADRLILLTDQPGLFTADPRRDQSAKLIERVAQIDAETYALAGGTATGLGTGGMFTKLQAAQLAARGGVTTWIASGKTPDALGRIVRGEAVGTRFDAVSTPLESRKRWLLVEKPHGRLTVDAGAARKLQAGGASLLPVGVTQVEGDFSRGETVVVLSPGKREIAHGITSYDAESARKLCGVKSSQIVEILGYTYGDALVHRNNMVLLK
ncbi:MAG: glutamate 5-kinase [Chloroflexi bacterium]|nr:glutamate 5-kinase [Chloroflexota bacterium]